MAQLAKRNIDRLLKWIMSRVNLYPNVNVTNYTTSWEDGIALCLLVNSLLGDEAIKRTDISKTNKKENFVLALNAATRAGVPDLLDPDDLVEYPIDQNSMITYLHSIYMILYVEKQRAQGINKGSIWRLSAASFDSPHAIEANFPSNTQRIDGDNKKNTVIQEHEELNVLASPVTGSSNTADFRNQLPNKYPKP